jgi:hypothetical protein
MSTMFHVTSVLNRASVQAHGLDWTRMGAARGIAGSSGPEEDGCFLAADQGEADYFVRMNNTGGPVDVWAVEGYSEDDLLDNGSGYYYLPSPVPLAQLTLLRTDAFKDSRLR